MRRLPGEGAEVFDEMRLIEIACLISKIGERHAGNIQADEVPESHDGGETFRRSAGDAPESFFERILVDAKRSGQLLHANVSACEFYFFYCFMHKRLRPYFPEL